MLLSHILRSEKKLSEHHYYYRFSCYFQNWPNTFVLLQKSFSLMLKMLKNLKKHHHMRQMCMQSLSLPQHVLRWKTSYTTHWKRQPRVTGDLHLEASVKLHKNQP